MCATVLLLDAENAPHALHGRLDKSVELQSPRNVGHTKVTL